MLTPTDVKEFLTFLAIKRKRSASSQNQTHVQKAIRAAVKKSPLDLYTSRAGRNIVGCKDAGNGEQALVYIGRYLYRGVIREKDILHCQNGMVTFRYRHAKSGEDRTRTVKGEYFLYLLMLHVLPRGFRRARSYGFLHACSKKLLRFLQLVLRVAPWRALARPGPQPEATAGNHLPGLRGRHGDHRDKDFPATGPSGHIVPASKIGGPAHVNRSGHHCCQPPACAATG